MLPIVIFLMLTALVIGTTTAISSYHWFLAWIGLEINTMAIIPLMMNTPHPRAIEASTKYFLTQASASITILFAAMVSFWKTGQWDVTQPYPSLALVMTLALAMKLGIAPFHFWVPEVLQGVSLKTGLLLMTWQKIAPMIIMYQFTHVLNMNLMMIMGFLSVIIGGWGIINQTEMRKVLAYSSIGHLGWTFVIYPINPELAMLNFFLYLTMALAIFTAFNTLTFKKISELSTSWSTSPALTTMTMMTLLSLSGLPPLTGFIPKLLIILYLIKNQLFIFASTLMIFSLLATYAYIRLTYFMLMFMNPNNTSMTTTWRSKTKYHPMLTIIMILSIMLVPSMSTILIFT